MSDFLIYITLNLHNLLLYWTPRANFRCNAWPIARTPNGVLSLESSLPPFAHFFSALNIFRWRWRRDPDIVLSLHQPRSPMFSKWNTMKHSKSSLALLPSNSWPRWWLAWLPSQNICAYHWGFWDIRFCHAPLQVRWIALTGSVLRSIFRFIEMAC